MTPARGNKLTLRAAVCPSVVKFDLDFLRDRGSVCPRCGTGVLEAPIVRDAHIV
jgi:hypothetical protein